MVGASCTSRRWSQTSTGDQQSQALLSSPFPRHYAAAPLRAPASPFPRLYAVAPLRAPASPFPRHYAAAPQRAPAAVTPASKPLRLMRRHHVGTLGLWPQAPKFPLPGEGQRLCEPGVSFRVSASAVRGDESDSQFLSSLPSLIHLGNQ